MTPGERHLVTQLVDDFNDDIERVEQPVTTSDNMVYVTYLDEEGSEVDDDLRGKTFRVVVEEVR